MARAILVINAGSSSVKFALYHGHAASELVAGPHGQVDGIGTHPQLSVTGANGDAQPARSLPAVTDHRSAISEIQTWLQEQLDPSDLHAVGHRIVHGGQRFTQPVRIDANVLQGLEELVPLAPLHQPHNLAAIRAVAETLPEVAQVACFDTAFHHAQPLVAYTFALPRKWSAAGIRRYGFHGLSYEYIVSVLPEIAPGVAPGRLVVAHLGNGASMCAIRGGRSVATTMGLTALDGLVMGTRSGAIDPGVLLYLMDEHGLEARALEQLLYYESGLLGVSGVSSDMRTLLASDHPHAKEAIDLFVYRIGRELGSLAAALGGLDALIFTGGIGENAPAVRARVCTDAAWLGITLDAAANQASGPRISRKRSRASAWVVRTDENLMIARHTLRLMRIDT